MAINLHDRWEKKAVQAFTTGSLLASRLNKDHSWTGVKTIKLSSIDTTDPVDYNRGDITTGASAYGPIKEVTDTVQELTVTQDKGWGKKIDRGNAGEQEEIKSASLVFAAQMRERDIPQAEKYAFLRLIQLAGKVVGTATDISKANICDRIDAGIVYQRGKSVPEEDKTLFMPSAVYTMLAATGRTLYSRGLAEKSFVNGQVDQYGNCAIVLVPDDRWPTGANFMIVSKSAATMPYKLTESETCEGGMLFSGTGLKARYIYDLFVIGRKCDGVYVDIDTDVMAKVADPAIAAATGVVTCATAGATIKYTVDGTDPRYSSTEQVIASGGTASSTAGTVIRAYAYKADLAPSDPVAATKS